MDIKPIIPVTSEQEVAMIERDVTEEDLEAVAKKAVLKQLNWLETDVKAELVASKTIAQLKGL